MNLLLLNTAHSQSNRHENSSASHHSKYDSKVCKQTRNNDTEQKKEYPAFSWNLSRLEPLQELLSIAAACRAGVPKPCSPQGNTSHFQDVGGQATTNSHYWQWSTTKSTNQPTHPPQRIWYSSCTAKLTCSTSHFSGWLGKEEMKAQKETEKDSKEEILTFPQLPLKTILSSEIHRLCWPGVI